MEILNKIKEGRQFIDSRVLNVPMKMEVHIRRRRKEIQNG